MLSKFKGGYLNRQTENDVNGTYQGKINRLPGAFVRSASSDKLRQASQMSNTQRSQHNQNSLASSRNRITSQIYKKMLSAKLDNHNQQQSNKDVNFKNQTQEIPRKSSSNALKQRLLSQNAQNKKCTFKQQLSSRQQQQIRECTFKPKINETKNNRRTLQQFIDNQMQYQKYKGEKVQHIKNMLKANMEKQNTFRPIINNKSRSNQIMSRKESKDRIYDRLYQQSKDRQEKHHQIVEQEMQKIVKQANRSINRISSISRPSSKTQTQKEEQKIAQSKQFQSHANRTQSKHQRPYHDKLQNMVPNQYESTGPQQFNLKLNEESDRNNSNACNNVNHYSNNSASLTERTNPTCRSNSRRNSRGLNLTNVNSHNNQSRGQSPMNSIMKRKNEQIVINKFLRQIIAILNKVQPSSQRVSYMEMCFIVTEMKFISSSNVSSHSFTNISDNNSQNQSKKLAQGQLVPLAALQQRKFLYQIWEMLQGDSLGSISLISLLKIIFAILGCHEVSLVAEVLQKKINFSDFRGKNAYQNLILTEKDSRNLKARFQSFYNNRLKEGPYSDKVQEQYSFKPQISKTSAQMAEKYRMRVIDQSQKLLDQKLIDFKIPQNGQISHVDLLLLDEKRKELRLKLQRQQQQRNKKIEQDKAMGIYYYDPPRQTFNPTEDYSSINQANQNQSNTTSRPQTGRAQPNNTSKFIQLYEQGKSYVRRDRSEDEIKAEKWQKQLTFKPHINPYNGFKQRDGLISQNNMLDAVPDFDKAVFRMYQGRKMKSKPQLENKQSPLLYLEQKSGAYFSNRTSEDLLSANYSSIPPIKSQFQKENNYIKSQQTKQQANLKRQTSERPLVYLNINMEGAQSAKIPVFKHDNLSTIAQKVRVMMGIDQSDFGQGQTLQDLLKDQVQVALAQVQ